MPRTETAIVNRILGVFSALTLFASSALAQTPAVPIGPGGGGNGGGGGSFGPALTGYASPTALAAATIPSSVTQVYVQSVSGAYPVSMNISTCPLIYHVGTSSSTGLYGEVLNIAANIYWEPNYNTSPVRTCEFGAIGDGSYSYATGAATGTDNIAIVQAAVNFAQTNRFNTVCVNDGTYKTTDTIKIGPGNGFYEINLVACSGGREAFYAPGQAGVSFLPTQTDRCALNFQGGRMVGINGISFVGQNYIYAGNLKAGLAVTAGSYNSGTGLVTLTLAYPMGLTTGSSVVTISSAAGTGSFASINGTFVAGAGTGGSTVTFTVATSLTMTITSASAKITFPSAAAGWLDPALAKSGANPGGLQTNSPYSAICIDAYGGTTPAAPYPGIVYGQPGSSDITIEDVQVIGFAVGINHEPNANANGDFLKVDKFDCQMTVFCASVGNTQSRSMQYQNITGNAVYTMLTNNQFGQGQGEIDGPVNNWSCSECYQFFQFGNLGGSGPLVLNGLYAEAIVRLGSINASSAFPFSLQINGCHVNIYQTLTGVIPNAMVEMGASVSTIQSYENCSLGAGLRIDTLVHGATTVSIDGGFFAGSVNVGSEFGTAAWQQAVNYCGSICIGGALTYAGQPGFGQLTWRNSTYATFYTTPSGAIGSQNMGQLAGGARAQFTQGVNSFIDGLLNKRWDFATGPQLGLLQLSSLGSGDVSTVAAITSCDQLTFSLTPSRMLAANQNRNIAVGDLLYNTTSGDYYVVNSVTLNGGTTDYDIVATQTNDMLVNLTSGACVLNTSSNPTLTSFTFVIHTGMIISTNVYFGDFTSGSTAVANVQLGNGSGAALTTAINNGDKMWTYQAAVDAYFQTPFQPGTTISSCTNGSPGSCVLSLTSNKTGRFPLLPLPTKGGPQ